jgi:DNA-binding response OmpR family regulator
MPKVLLVEDDINLREIYAARLTAENYQVAVASDGEEALAKAVAEKPDLIVLDIMMPKISGFDVLDILRSTPATKKTRVVMLTALSQSVDKERGQKLGVDKYLVKSQITLEDVVDTVKQMLVGLPQKNTANKGKVSQKAAIDGALKNLQSNFDNPKRKLVQQQPSQMAQESPKSNDIEPPQPKTPGSNNPNNAGDAL